MAASHVQVEKCEKCLNYYMCNSVHQCIPVAVEKPSKFKNIVPAECLEKNKSLFALSDDEDSPLENEFHSTSSFISAIEVRRPLYDHRMSLSKRSEAIKNKLWNEVYVELQGQFTIEDLKKKWRYLREKFVREKQKPKSGSKGGTKAKWVHYDQMSFLEDVVTHDKKTTSNLQIYSDDSSQCSTSTKGYKRKSTGKTLHDDEFQRDLLNELKMSRPKLPEPNEEHDPDVAFGNYLVSLMKEVPKQIRKKLQCEIIQIVINAQD